MTRTGAFFWYSVTFVGVVVFDRITKYWALASLDQPYVVNEFLSFELTFNRGISWGMFNTGDQTTFAVVSIAVALITCVLVGYAYMRWQDARCIAGEVLIIAGSCSNLVDRLLYKGVVDFIHFHAYGWSWPLFNVADMSIVLGVGIVFFLSFRD